MRLGLLCIGLVVFTGIALTCAVFWAWMGASPGVSAELAGAHELKAYAALTGAVLSSLSVLGLVAQHVVRRRRARADHERE